jgi:multimeric flavodoxin WrbA
MKKVLGIIGSKRSSGNCEIMTKEISRQIPEPHQLTLLRLPDFDVRYCTGCYRCLIKGRGCVLDDDLSTVLEAISDADALILAVPTYFLSAHSCLKAFLDRAISFYSQADSLWGKPAVGVGTAGIEGKEGSTLLDIERFFATMMAINKQSRIIYGALPGETMLIENNRQVAAELAHSLFGPAKPKEGICCPLCGGETFRFLEGDRVRCMLCSESGALTARDGQFVLDIEAGDHVLLANKEEALKHRDWLLGMVGRFKEQKDNLREVAAEYADETPWISPKQK